MLKRVLIKISGEAFGGGKEGGGVDPDSVFFVAEKIKEVRELGVEVAIVIGGGNIFRWRAFKESGMDRVFADTMGILATVINGVALEDALRRVGVSVHLFSALEVPKVCDPYTVRGALKSLESGNVVILAGGTGGPFFTTDTASAIRACELKAEAIVKASNVDGVYDLDPKKNSNAKRFVEISFEYAIQKNLSVMDMAAFAICKENNIPIIVLNFSEKDALKKAILGERVGTLVR